MSGDVDIASVAALLAEPAPARILFALDDRRALPASMLAAEAGVAASTGASSATIWRASSDRPCCGGCWSSTGSSVPAPAGRSG